jgi:SAM-dependent methyltransferase
VLHNGAMGNEEQARYWGEEAGPIWVELQDRFDAITGPFGELALSAAAVAPGEAVLDVGCGCGTTVLELARRTGEGGRVTGVDISAVMLGPGRLPYQRASEQARERAREAVDAVIGPHRGPEGVVMPAACWVVTARTR